MSEEEKNLEENKPEYKVSQVGSYTRKQMLYDYTCQLPECPYCHNVVQQSLFKGRKWCREDARMEFKRRERAQKAIAANRDPGVLGKPTNYEDRLKRMGVFFIHILDDSQLYRMSYSKSWEEYQNEYLLNSGHEQDFDAVLVVRTPLANTLINKLNKKFKQFREGESNLFHIGSSEIKIAHMLVKEHLHAHRK
jgi:hypothetical protein